MTLVRCRSVSWHYRAGKDMAFALQDLRINFPITSIIRKAHARGHQFVADLNPMCVPIVGGNIVQDLSALTGR